jgi:hypothetical protein
MAVKLKFWVEKPNYEVKGVNNVCLKWFSWKIDWLFSVLCPAQKFFHLYLYMETPSLLVWLQNLVLECLNWHSEPLSRKGFLLCHTCCDTGPQFFRRTTPFNCILRHTLRGCGESIQTRILTGQVEWDCLYTNRGIRLPWPNLLFTSQARDSEPCRFPVGTLFIWWHMVLLQGIC